MRAIYTLMWYLLLPALFLRLWWRGRRAPAYRHRWRERLAFYGDESGARGSIWVHAVSVGETLAAAPMIRELLRRYPGRELVVTTTTPTGSERVGALFGDRVHHVYCPWDLPGALSRFFRVFDPALVLVMETELWPNLAAAARGRDVPLVLVNGRLSRNSFRGYRRLGPLVRPMLACFSRLLVQTAEDAARFRALGVPEERLRVTGSVKFDLTVDEALRETAAELNARWAPRPSWIAASTHAGEDEPVLKAHRAVLEAEPGALLVLVPRHPERFDDVAALVRDRGFTLARRSAGESPARVQVYLADTMGELLMLYGATDVAFVAGSLVPVGGHNLLEPAAWAKPVLSGPRLHNFRHIAGLLSDAGALAIVQDAGELGADVSRLLEDGGERVRRGEAANAVVAAHRGALQGVLDEVSALLPALPPVD